MKKCLSSAVLALVLTVPAPVRAQEIDLLGLAPDQDLTDAPGSSIPEGIRSLVALAHKTRTARTEWGQSRPLSEAKNAHKTNTKEQMKAALEDGYSFLEGDVREEINHQGAIEMRHDTFHESGDNLTLREWLIIGKASGRGLKLDVKEPEHMARILAEVEQAGIPEDRLMFNLGASGMARWGQEIRDRFPGAILALNPPSGEGKLSDHQVDVMLGQARTFGAPVTFVVRYDLLTDPAIRRLEATGPVSVWNSPSGGKKVEDPGALAKRLRARGVTGVIDLRESDDWIDKIPQAIDKGLNAARTGLDKAKNAVTSLFD